MKLLDDRETSDDVFLSSNENTRQLCRTEKEVSNQQQSEFKIELRAVESTIDSSQVSGATQPEPALILLDYDSVSDADKFENLGTLLSERGEVRKELKELEKHEQQLRKRFATRRAVFSGVFTPWPLPPLPPIRSLRPSASPIPLVMLEQEDATQQIVDIYSIVYLGLRGSFAERLRSNGCVISMPLFLASRSCNVVHYEPIQALFDYQLTLVTERIFTLKQSLRLYNHRVSISVRRARIGSFDSNVVLIQEAFFTLHSFHPPHVCPFLRRFMTFGGCGMAA